jgi:hypothetical protein
MRQFDVGSSEMTFVGMPRGTRLYINEESIEEDEAITSGD